MILIKKMNENHAMKPNKVSFIYSGFRWLNKSKAKKGPDEPDLFI